MRICVESLCACWRQGDSDDDTATVTASAEILNNKRLTALASLLHSQR